MKALSQYIWKNGSIIPWESATTHVLTHSLHYSGAVFEGIRAYNTPNGACIFRAQEHFQRLIESAATYHIQLPYTCDELIEATRQLIQKNNLKSCYIRPIVYHGYGSMGIIPKDNPVDVVIAAWEWGAYLGEDGIQNGIRCTLSPWEKFSSKALPATAKCTANYANSFLAKHDALSRGFDEAILLSSTGFVAEGPGENIFIVKDQHISSPSISDDALDGITAHTIIDIIRHLGYTFDYRHVQKEDLFSADELFFTGTAAEVTPIREIDHSPIGNGGKGPITSQIQDLFFQIVNGKSNDFSHWLTPASLVQQ